MITSTSTDPATVFDPMIGRLLGVFSEATQNEARAAFWEHFQPGLTSGEKGDLLLNRFLAALQRATDLALELDPSPLSEASSEDDEEAIAASGRASFRAKRMVSRFRAAMCVETYEAWRANVWREQQEQIAAVAMPRSFFQKILTKWRMRKKFGL